MSIILTNLQVNFEGWKAELPKEEEPSKEEGKAESGEEDESAVEPEDDESGNEDVSVEGRMGGVSGCGY